MRTLTLFLLLCIVSISTFGQTQKHQINYRRTGGGGEVVVMDKPFSGNVASFRHEWDQPRTTIIRSIVTVRNSGVDREIIVGAGAKINKNGNLAHLQDIRVGDFIGGFTDKESPFAKSVNLTTPQPAPVARPKVNATNAPTATVSTNRPSS